MSSAVNSRSCDRWYIGLNGGWQERETVHEVGDPQTFIVFDSGFLINAQLGFRFDLFRVEAEYTFMNNDVDRAGAGGADTPAAGNVNLKAFMFNIYHDFNLFDWLWEPYVGAGIGIYQSELNSLYPDFFDAFGAPFAGTSVNATSNMPLAYQFRAGASRPVGRRTELLIGYRFFKGEELEFSSAPFATFAPTFHPDGAEIHSLEAGLRVRF
jgi:opacity protein-like surface antigen